MGKSHEASFPSYSHGESDAYTEIAWDFLDRRSRWTVCAVSHCVRRRWRWYASTKHRRGYEPARHQRYRHITCGALFGRKRAGHSECHRRRIGCCQCGCGDYLSRQYTSERGAEPPTGSVSRHIHRAVERRRWQSARAGTRRRPRGQPSHTRDRTGRDWQPTQPTVLARYDDKTQQGIFMPLQTPPPQREGLQSLPTHFDGDTALP